jgi:predicted molibdopterin-dependent oxidoreductase YjgC
LVLRKVEPGINKKVLERYEFGCKPRHKTFKARTHSIRINKSSTGTMTMETEGLNDRVPESFVEISSEDADESGLKEGDRVTVASRTFLQTSSCTTRSSFYKRNQD